jgi:hypothetical protein
MLAEKRLREERRKKQSRRQRQLDLAHAQEKKQAEDR